MVLCEGQALEVQIFKQPLKMIRNTNVDDTTNALPFAKHVLQEVRSINVVSLFNGMGTLRQAFHNLGIKVNNLTLYHNQKIKKYYCIPDKNLPTT
jgi:hypothetical protein